MFPTVTITCRPYAAIEAFQRFRRRGQIASLWANLFAENAHLEDFDAYAPLLKEGRKYLGLQDVPVWQITGSVGRSKDFDRGFRPLKTHLRDRWAEAYLRSRMDSWPPIKVYKVGENYFVEDGHHRVSVARYLGMVFIQAEVWEYPWESANHEACAFPRRTVAKRQVEPAAAKC